MLVFLLRPAGIGHASGGRLRLRSADRDFVRGLGRVPGRAAGIRIGEVPHGMQSNRRWRNTGPGCRDDVYAAVTRSRRKVEMDTTGTITVGLSEQEVYEMWRHLDNLPKFMAPLE